MRAGAKLVLTGPLGPEWLLLCGLLLVAVALWIYRTSPLRPKPERLVLLVFLRALAISCALFALAGPAVRSTELISERLRLPILIDHSRSMSVSDGLGGMPRAKRCEKVFEENGDSLGKIREEFELEYYALGESLRRLDRPRFAALSPGTALGNALMKVASLSGQGKVGAVLLVSDGVSNYGEPMEAAINALSAAKIPVFALQAGGESGRERPAEGDLPAPFRRRSRWP